MYFVIFGLTVSSSWGNGHATLWRGLLRALAERGHSALFLERDASYYLDSRDNWTIPESVRVQLYGGLNDLTPGVKQELDRADVAIVTSFCPQGGDISSIVLDSRARIKLFYDLDTPVTLTALNDGESVPYLPSYGLGDFDLVLSYTGGRALRELEGRLGARRAVPFYGWVDPQVHCPSEPRPEFKAELSYMGTFAADRQAALEELFLRPARVQTQARFVIGGAQYPEDFPWSENIHFVRHLPPALHPAFFSSSRATLNVTRKAMADYGYCPSGRLFEAAACGALILTDVWEGLEKFFVPGQEVMPVACCNDVIEVLQTDDAVLQKIAQAGLSRVLQDHTAAARARELESILQTSAAPWARDAAVNSMS